MNKVIERILLSRLINFTTANKILDQTQYGYTNGFGAQDAIFKLLHEASKSLDDNECFFIIFFDLQKTFDYVDHNSLLFKLDCVGIKDIANELIKNYLTGRSFSAKYNNSISSQRQICSGYNKARSSLLFSSI